MFRSLTYLIKEIDDLLVCGVDIDEVTLRVREVLTVCRQNNLTISPSKFKLGQQIKFAGFVVDASSGEVIIQPDPEKIWALQEVKHLKGSKSYTAF